MWEVSIGSWTPVNAKSAEGNNSTIAEYIGFIERNGDYLFKQHKKLVVFVDELDKLSQSATDNANWCSFVWSELMRVIDGRLVEFGVNTHLARQAQLSTYFIFAGAFQRLWDKRTGKIGFLEQVEDAELDLAAVSRAGILPKELLNRVSGMTVFVSPPGVDEIVDRLREIEDTFLMSRHEKDLERDAKDILTSGQYVRGIEQHFTKLAVDQFVPDTLKDELPEHPDNIEDAQKEETISEEAAENVRLKIKPKK